jgi:CRP/FNR family transcriptional regulator
MRQKQAFINDFALPRYPSRIYRHQKGWEQLERLGDRVFYPKDHAVISPGDTLNYCFLVIKGRVASLEYTPEGAEHIFNIFEDGSIFFESNLLLDIPAAVYFQTLTTSELVRITKHKLSEAMSADCNIVNFLMESMAYKFYSAMDQLRENYNHDAMWKVYNMLMILAKNFGTKRGEWTMINLKVSQQMLSNLLGINRITIVKVIKDLKALELIEQVNGYYCILEAKQFRKY